MSSRNWNRTRRKKENSERDYEIKTIAGYTFEIPKDCIKTIPAKETVSGVAIRVYPGDEHEWGYMDGGKQIFDVGDGMKICPDFAYHYGPSKVKMVNLMDMVKEGYLFLVVRGYKPSPDNIERLIKGAMIEVLSGDVK